MNKLRFLFLILVLFSLNLVIAQANYYYELDLSFTGQNIKLDSVDVSFSHSQLENFVVFGEENYDLKVVDARNSELYSEIFSLPNLLIGEGLEEEGSFIESQGEFSLVIPYNNNAHKIVIYNQGVEMDSILVSQYSKKGFDINDFKDKEVVSEVRKDLDNKIRNNNVVVIDGGGSSIIVLLWIILALLIGILVYLVRKK